MDKTAIKTFAINSRKKLMEDVEYKMSLVGINKDSISEPISSADGIETYQIGGSTNSIYDEDISKRKQLVKEVKLKGFENVVEEVAYTWFNRIIAIRFMEINNFLPTKTRVLSSETPGKIEPDIITEAFDIDLDYTQEDKELIFKLKDENKLDELFRFLFIKQSNKLNEILPGLFEKTDDYLELLLNISFTNEDGVVRRLIDNIPEEDFIDQVEIIGWLYQFYNTELKKSTDKNYKKVPKERLPSVTQLFTPDWIVRYMVENSLGRLWLEEHDNNELRSNWTYYVDTVNQDETVTINELKDKYKSFKLEDIKVIDPCMGSGHILVYIFEILMQIYLSEGFTQKDAALSIIKNNLYGLDIDKRAYQFSYFAILMKARKYNRKILENINPLVSYIEESNNLSENFIEFIITNSPSLKDDILYIIETFIDAKELGSIIPVKKLDFDKIIFELSKLKSKTISLDYYNSDWNILNNLIFQAKILSLKYDVLITNPPYLGNNRFDKKLKDYIYSNYPLSKNDLYSVFLEKGLEMVNEGGYNCMVTMQSWMFNSKFKKFRGNILEKSFITSLLHMESGVLGIAFGTSATVFRKGYSPKFNAVYNYIKFNDIDKNKGQPIDFPVSSNNNVSVSLDKFKVVPDNPIAYWLTEREFDIFKNESNLLNYAEPRQGLATSNNNKFLRFWYEVDFNKTSFNTKSQEEALNNGKKWFACTKGGPYRKWYGNNTYLVDWENNGYEMKKTVMEKYTYLDSPDFVIKNQRYYFKKGITWSTLTSGKPSFRNCSNGFIPETKGSICYPINEKNQLYILALLNSNVCYEFLNVLSPTFDLHEGPLGKVPFILNNTLSEEISNLSQNSINICKDDWDDYEISWDFKKHPFIKFYETNLDITFEIWKNFKNHKFNLLKSNEIKINELFSKIYEVNIDASVDDKFISVNQSEYEKDVKSFISYAVGCIFGRYNLDNEGLQFAGGNFDLNNYHKFVPDDDNIIPVLDSEYFEDDAVGRFIEFVKTCFGEENLEENLDFIADALAKNKKPSREKIRYYLLKNFFNDHKKAYKKCPIYWQFSSGKENGFNCLVYMHRYEPSLVARIRTEYLHKTQKAIEQAISNCDNIINHSSSNSEITKATKDKNKLQKQLKETQEYDEALAHIANQNIEINLDDGVKVNYAKFQNVEVSKEGKKSKKINLLKKL